MHSYLGMREYLFLSKHPENLTKFFMSSVVLHDFFFPDIFRISTNFHDYPARVIENIELNDIGLTFNFVAHPILISSSIQQVQKIEVIKKP